MLEADSSTLMLCYKFLFDWIVIHGLDCLNQKTVLKIIIVDRNSNGIRLLWYRK
jgi:hypothetical protein